MCIIPENSDSIIFLGISVILNLKYWSYVEYTNEQFVSATPLQPLHGIKASVTTGRNCLVIVRVLRVLPFVAPVVARSVKNRVEVI